MAEVVPEPPNRRVKPAASTIQIDVDAIVRQIRGAFARCLTAAARDGGQTESGSERSGGRRG